MSLFTLTSAVPGRMCLILLLFAAFVPPPATPENETGVLFPEIQNPKSKIQNLNSALPSAADLLAEVRGRLPQKTLQLKGQVLSGGRIGKLSRAGHIEMLLDFGGDPVLVCYKISDAFGDPAEEVTITMTPESDPEFEYESTAAPGKAGKPDPAGSIMNTDVTWGDLGLLFLWRQDGRTQRAENLRGRDCYVVVFPLEGDGMQIVWIDAQMLIALQMEEIDADGRLRRRMTVKNIKKISEQWMIKNLEIRSYPSLHHTLIRIDTVVHSE